MNNDITEQERKLFTRALSAVIRNAREHKHKRPAMSTLLEEMAEAILSSRGKHHDYLELEIIQIGGICINILWQLYDGQEKHVCNIGHGSRPMVRDSHD